MRESTLWLNSVFCAWFVFMALVTATPADMLQDDQKSPSDLAQQPPAPDSDEAAGAVASNPCQPACPQACCEQSRCESSSCGESSCGEKKDRRCGKSQRRCRTRSRCGRR
jgi:hypothetical protein